MLTNWMEKPVVGIKSGCIGRSIRRRSGRSSVGVWTLGRRAHRVGELVGLSEGERGSLVIVITKENPRSIRRRRRIGHEQNKK